MTAGLLGAAHRRHHGGRRHRGRRRRRIPNIALAEAAGLDLAAGGIAVDATLRTSDPDIYAAGDIAAHDHPKYADGSGSSTGPTAKDQGNHVAGNLLGADAPYEKRPFFFSDQYDLGCEYRGLADPATNGWWFAAISTPGISPPSGSGTARVAAAMNVNQWDDGDALQELVDSGRPVEIDQLVSGSLS